MACPLPVAQLSLKYFRAGASPDMVVGVEKGKPVRQQQPQQQSRIEMRCTAICSTIIYRDSKYDTVMMMMMMIMTICVVRGY